MKRIVLAAVALAFSGTALAQSTYVKGYTKRDGTYVAPHYRSSPNSTTLDNYSTKGNVNPYTGEVGTRNPYRSSTTPLYDRYSPPAKPAPCYLYCPD